MDFVRDLASLLRRRPGADGFNVPDESTDKDVCLQFINYMNRLVEPRPRQILMADTFALPCDPALRDGLNHIVHCIRNGLSLDSHFTKRVKQVENDSMLTDWGVHHLHLGTKIIQGFVERTRSLLYARFDSEYAYLIGIFDHAAWTRQEVVEVLHRNWPNSIRQYKAAGLSPDPSLESRRKELRKKGGVVLTSVADGTVYFPIGGGYTTSGMSIVTLIECDRLITQLRSFESVVEQSIDALYLNFKDPPFLFPKNPEFYLDIKEGVAFAVEKNSGIRIRLGALGE